MSEQFSHIATADHPLNQLVSFPHWVAWHIEERGGKPTKVPYDPQRGERASSTNPKHWATFDVAVRAFDLYPYDGIGYVFTSDDSVVGIDLDKCVKDGKAEPWAQEIIDSMDSYTELSPSGTGVHIFVHGELPGTGHKKGPIEIYDRSRYFTVTGTPFEQPRQIANRDIELLDFLDEYMTTPTPSTSNLTIPASVRTYRNGKPYSDDELKQRMLSAKNGAKWRQLWRGDTAGYRSPSEADLALVQNLVWWAQGDIDQVDRVFQESGLCRDKWIDREDYKMRTFVRASKETA